MGAIFSKRTKKDKEKLQEDFDTGEQNDQIQIVTPQNKSVIHGLLIVLFTDLCSLLVCLFQRITER